MPRSFETLALPQGAAEVDLSTVPRRELSGKEASYVISASIGEGAMGEVLLANQSGLEREVALKHLIQRDGDQSIACQRMIKEARITARLEHPNIISVYDIGLDDEKGLFYTMHHLSGQTWLEAFAGRPVSSEQFDQHVDVLLRVCDAMAYAHAQGIIHRDLKPGNVMLGDHGEVVVFDWGVAAFIGSDDLPMARVAERPQPHSVIGTPAYMAPEMALGQTERLGPASDVYLLAQYYLKC